MALFATRSRQPQWFTRQKVVGQRPSKLRSQKMEEKWNQMINGIEEGESTKPHWFPRKKVVRQRPSKLRVQTTDKKWNQKLYDRINGIENAEESTNPQKPLRLGTSKSFRRRVRAFRVRVSKFRIRIRLSPHLWLKKFCDANMKMMLAVQDSMGGTGSYVVGFYGALPTACPGKRRL